MKRVDGLGARIVVDQRRCVSQFFAAHTRVGLEPSKFLRAFAHSPRTSGLSKGQSYLQTRGQLVSELDNLVPLPVELEDEGQLRHDLLPVLLRLAHVVQRRLVHALDERE